MEHFRSLGFKKFRTEEFYDMVCDCSSFSPSSLERLAVKLGEEYVPLYRDLEFGRGIEITLDEASKILEKYTHYGVIVNNTLAFIVARYVTPLGSMC